MNQILEFFPGSRRVSNLFINFVYLFIFFACPVVVVVVVVVVAVTGFVLKRLFASVATVCLEVGPSAVKHHRSFLEPFSVTSKVIETFEAHQKLATPARNRHVAIVITMVYAIRKRKVEQSLRGTQDYVSTLRIVDT